ncbi:MAG: preprotein translocase subunit YajC [Acidaminococcaceae bacterium]
MEVFGGEPMAIVNTVWPFLLMGFVFYFMLYRPQKKEQVKRDKLLGSLKKGDKVVTIGGIYGTITTIGELKVTLMVANNVEVEFVRSSISHFQDATKQELVEK